MAESKQCIFRSILKTCSDNSHTLCPIPLTDKRIQKILESSKKRADKFKAILVERNADELQYHKTCYASYNSNSMIERHLKTKRKLEKSQAAQQTSSPSKRLRRRYAYHFLFFMMLCIL